MKKGRTSRPWERHHIIINIITDAPLHITNKCENNLSKYKKWLRFTTWPFLLSEIKLLNKGKTQIL